MKLALLNICRVLKWAMLLTSLILFLLSLSLWIRSEFSCDVVTFETVRAPTYRYWHVYLLRQGIAFESFSEHFFAGDSSIADLSPKDFAQVPIGEMRRVSLDSTTPPSWESHPPVSYTKFHWPSKKMWALFQFRYSSTKGSTVMRFENPTTLETVHPHVILGDTIVAIPYWFSLIALGLFPLVTLINKRRKRTLVRKGLCRQCSYDLRAHAPGDKCPECGTPIALPTPKVP